MGTSPRVVFMGTPEFAVPPLAALLQAGYDVEGVLTREDSLSGRGRKVEASPVKQFALAEKLLIQQPHTLRAPHALAALAALQPDLIIVAAYGLILPQTVLDLPAKGCINIHGSLLPRHRGAAPIAAAILDGDSETGVSVMLMDAGVDTGPVLSRASVPIRGNDTTGSLTQRLAALGAELLICTLPDWLAGKVKPAAQPEEGASYAQRIEKQDGRIRWEEPAARIARRVRAYQPWPSAYTSWRGLTLKVVRAEAAGDNRSARATSWDPGTVVEDAQKRAGVISGDGVLWLEEVQLAGKRALPIEVFLMGAPGFVGSRLE
jgi:methionyl-tRNA formyltransferase